MFWLCTFNCQFNTFCSNKHLIHYAILLNQIQYICDISGVDNMLCFYTIIILQILIIHSAKNVLLNNVVNTWKRKLVLSNYMIQFMLCCITLQGSQETLYQLISCRLCMQMQNLRGAISRQDISLTSARMVQIT